MTLPPLREVIARHGLSASKALGQNFLLDEQLLDRIAALPGDLGDRAVLEVGPGPGGLTLIVAKLPMRCRRRMNDEASGIPNVGEKTEKLQVRDKPHARFITTLEAEREDGAAPARCRKSPPRANSPGLAAKMSGIPSAEVMAPQYQSGQYSLSKSGITAI